MFLIIILIIINIIFFHSTILGTILAAIYLIIYGREIGKWIFPEESIIWQTFSGIFFILSFFSLLGAIIYYFYRLNTVIIFLTLVSSPLIIKGITLKWPQENIKFKLWKEIIPLLPKISLFLISKNKIKKILYNKFFLLRSAYLISVIALFIILLRSSTAEAIRSPWFIIPHYFFIIYILSTLILITLIWHSNKPHISLIILHTFLSSSIALIVYKIGYGFDPFIHQATEKLIFENGIITPKPLYYLGQYSIVVMLAKIFQIEVVKIDKILVPLLFSLYVPSFIFYSFKKAFTTESKYASLASLSFLILPFTSFIYTTPQSLANIYAIIIIFLSLIFFQRLNDKNYKLFFVLLFLNAAAIAIHPLAGVPITIFIIILFLNSPLSSNLMNTKIIQKNITKKLSLTAVFIFSSFILPIIFLVNSFISSSLKTKIKIQPINFKNVFNNIIFFNGRQYHLIRDFIYLYGLNIIPIFLLISILGIIIWRFRNNLSHSVRFPIPYILTFFILIINYIILKKFISFESIISYEQNNYSERILLLANYFLLPFFLTSIYYFFRKLSYAHSATQDQAMQGQGILHYPGGTDILTNEEIENSQEIPRCPGRSGHLTQPKFLCIKLNNYEYRKSSRFFQFYNEKIFFIIFFSLWITASLYLTYPRFDNYTANAGYNVSESDLKAVEFIEKNAKTDYIVLANQNTSAAALLKYGFKKYYSSCRENTKSHEDEKICDNNIFYYPIPTSSPLYEFYLDMVNKKPSRETMEKAMHITGVKEGYFVINNYWWQAKEIVIRAKPQADEWKEIDNGKIWVFKYGL